MTIYLTDDAFSVKAKRLFTSILACFFLLRIANKSRFYAPSFDELISLYSPLSNMCSMVKRAGHQACNRSIES